MQRGDRFGGWLEISRAMALRDAERRPAIFVLLIPDFDPGAFAGEELYDLDADPAELNNLIRDPAQSARIEKLRAALIAECKRTDAPFELQP